MQNAGLPEAGDFVLAFPLEASSLTPPPTPSWRAGVGGRRVRHRGSALRAAAGSSRSRGLPPAAGAGAHAEGLGALDDFYAAALRLVAPKLDGWERRWRDGAAAHAALTGERLDALRRGDAGHLRGDYPSSPPAAAGSASGCGYLSPTTWSPPPRPGASSRRRPARGSSGVLTEACPGLTVSNASGYFRKFLTVARGRAGE